MSEKEVPSSKEHLQQQPSFDLVLARHAAYVDPRAEKAMREQGTPDEEIREKVGHLTEEGKKQASNFGLDILNRALASGEDIDVTFIASTQPYESPAYPDAPWSGRRAEETSGQAISAMLERMGELQAEGSIRPDQIRIATPRPEKTFAEGERPNERLVERQVYFPINELNTSMISRYRDRTEQVMDDEGKAGVRVTGGYKVPSEGAESGHSNFDKREKELWGRGEADIDRFAKQMSAETSTDVSGRVMSVVEDINELAALHAEREPNRKLLVVLLSHDAVVGAVTVQSMGAENPVVPSYMDSIDISVQDGVVSFEQDGNINERPL